MKLGFDPDERVHTKAKVKSIGIKSQSPTRVDRWEYI